MAFDKVIDSAKLNGAMSQTAMAIRNKTGEYSGEIVWNPETGFKDAVDAMTVGGSGSEWEVLMPETPITFTDGGEYITFEQVCALTLDAKYKVVWEGTEYEVTAVETVFQDMPCIAVGNVGALDGNPGTEPFIIGYIPSVNGFGIMRMDGADVTASVAIYRSALLLPVVRPLEITENGTYTVPDGVDGFSPVTVNVASSGSAEGAHTVTFMNDSGTVTYGTKPVFNGDTCGDPLALGLFATPAKESTAQYNYPFYGWATTPNGAADSNALVNITADRTLYANFASTVRYYTVNYYDGDTLIKSEQLAYGTMPSYIPEKEGFAFNGWSPAVSKVTSDIDYLAQWSSTVNFANSSWEQISEVCESGEAANVFAVGDQRTIITTDEQTYTLEIVGINHDDLADGTGKAGISIITKNVSDEYFSFNNSVKYYNGSSSYSSGGWGISDIRTYCNDTIFATLPNELQAVIKSVKKLSDYGYQGNNSELRETADKVWLPSLEEVGLYPQSGYTATGQGTAYAYFTNATTRKKKCNSDTYNYQNYRTRTCIKPTSHSVYHVDFNGSRASATGGGIMRCSFGFCI